jgi:sensor histidine kinase YesM
MNGWFVAILVFFSFFSIYNHFMFAQLNEMYNHSMANFHNILDLKKQVQKSHNYIDEYFRNGNRTNLAEYNEANDRFYVLLKYLKNQAGSVETKSLLQSLDSSFYSYQRESNYVAANYYEKDNRYYSNMYQAQKINLYIQQYCDEMLNSEVADSFNKYESMASYRRSYLLINISVLISMIPLSIFVVSYMNIHLAMPLNSLYLAALQIADGNFDVKIDACGLEKTLQVLADAFNYMRLNIKNMLEDVKATAQAKADLLLEKLKNIEYQQLLDRARFQVLQAQINPHFIFNTLNSISRTILLQMNDEAVAMIDLLASLLRYNLGDADNHAYIGEELESVEKYLKIQQYRFSNRISYEIHCDEKLQKTVLVPRFTIQPLVENAVIHGLESRAEGGTIAVRVARRQDDCVIQISDNGVGMSEKRLRELTTTQVKERGHINAIGVKNTMDRIRLFTDKDDSFHITSELGVGTVLRLTVPIRGVNLDV